MYLDVGQKIAVNVLHPSERVVRQVESVELIQLVVVRNVELKLKENMNDTDAPSQLESHSVR